MMHYALAFTDETPTNDATTDASQDLPSLWSDPIEWAQNLTFSHPLRLWWLIGLALLLAIYAVLQFRRHQYAIRFANVELLEKVIPTRANWKRHIPPVLFLMGMLFGIVAWAEPNQVVQVPSERATIVLAIDTSISMRAEDVSPSRIEGAKDAAAEFLEDLPAEINVGLVSFNGIATLRVPPTKNRASVASAIQGLELGEGTAIGEAIFSGAAAIDAILPDDMLEQQPARIVLMTDGKTNSGRPDAQAIEAARRAGVPVSTIAFGTTEGVIDIDGFLQPVPVDFDALAVIAEGTGGEFFRAANTDELREVYDDIGSSIGFEPEVRPVTSPWIATALAFLLASWVLATIWRVTLPG